MEKRIVDVPDSEVTFVEAMLRGDGATEISKNRQANGLWTIVGTLPDSPGATTAPEPPPAAGPATAAPVTAAVAAPPAAFANGMGGLTDDVDTLARTIWGEARGESRQGREAVATVVLNRLKRASPNRFGRTVAEVCRKPSQFSCWNPNDINLPKLRAVDDTDPVFRECLQIARAAVAGSLLDPTSGADHYHAKGTAAGWAAGRQPCCTIGKHLFYNDIP